MHKTGKTLSNKGKDNKVMEYRGRNKKKQIKARKHCSSYK